MAQGLSDARLKVSAADVYVFLHGADYIEDDGFRKKNFLNPEIGDDLRDGAFYHIFSGTNPNDKYTTDYLILPEMSSFYDAPYRSILDVKKEVAVRCRILFNKLYLDKSDLFIRQDLSTLYRGSGRLDNIEEAGVSAEDVEDIVNGGNTDLETLQKIAKGLGLILSVQLIGERE